MHPFAVLCIAVMTLATTATARVGSVIFIHPDGASAATWAATRALHVGPDSDLNWDRLPAIALYRGHMRDSLTATSNGGATTHAFGVKVASDAFGMTAGGARAMPITDADGHSTSIAAQALRKGLRVGLVQSGIASEPGTAAFLAAVPSRRQHEDIAAQLIKSGAHVLLSGGERHFLPEGTAGVHGPGERTDGRNLIDEARAAGYTIVRTRDELADLPPSTDRVLGLFAWSSTFNDKDEQTLAERGLPLFDPETPTLAEMTSAALDVLSKDDSQFLLVIEEEGTDNFGNKNNAAGVMEAAKRADDAIGVAQDFLVEHPETLVITTADSDGGGLRMVGIPQLPFVTTPDVLPERDANGSPIDGVGGTGTASFIAQPDQFGQRLPFAVVWSARDDVAGGVLVRAQGLNAHLVGGSMDNTEVATLMRQTLFGTQSP